MVAYVQPPPQKGFGGFARRTAAYLIDAILLSFVGGAFPYLVISSSSQANQPSNAPVQGAGGGSILVSLIYFLIFWSYVGGGRTLGMRLLGVRVVRLDGTPLGLIDALIRWVGLWVAFAVCFIGVIWVAFDSRKQGWHDQLAHTVVIRV